MRFLLYFLIYSCLVIAVFAAMLYLMTVLDPGLLQLSDKAAVMMKSDRERVRVQDSPGVLPPEMYIDFSELLNRSRNKM